MDCARVLGGGIVVRVRLDPRRDVRRVVKHDGTSLRCEERARRESMGSCEDAISSSINQWVGLVYELSSATATRCAMHQGIPSSPLN